jgi:hypothetical protein
MMCTEHFLEIGGLPGKRSLSDMTVAIQGFGNAGSFAAKLFREAGATIIAVSDSKGGVFNENGLDINSVEAHKEETGSVVGAPGTEKLKPLEVLEVPCQILIPAALENQITMENAGRLQTRLIVEAANGPVTPGADRILAERDIKILPDILANAGGVVVSYFEWVQNLENSQRLLPGTLGQVDAERSPAAGPRHAHRRLCDRHRALPHLCGATGRLAVGRIQPAPGPPGTGSIASWGMRRWALVTCRMPSSSTPTVVLSQPPSARDW